jgi:oligosaccharyl transferase (archaeosortase A-associated)
MTDGQQDDAEAQESPFVTWFRERYQEATVFALAVFMLWVRVRSRDNFVRDGEVLFSGNDAYYHLREVSYTVRHWPATMPFDPWTYYPYGTNSNQFGTLYDQLVATAALVVGLGSPSEQTIALTLLYAPAVIGALVVVPAYYAGRRVGGVQGGLFGAVILALLPGSVLTRTLVGNADHQAIEILAQMTAVLAILVALGVAEEEKPVYELVLDRDLEALRRPVGWAAVAGIAMGLYVWTWPPAVLLIAVAGVFFAVKMSADHFNGGSPEPVGFVAVVSMAVTGVMSLLPLNSAGFTPTGWSLLQPAAAFGIAAGAVALAWMAREWEDRDIDPALYPVSVGAVAAIGALVVSVALPDVWSTLARNFQRILGFSAGAGTRTIVEAQPFLSQANRAVSPAEVVALEYGLTFFTAIAAVGVILARPLFYSRDRADHATLVGGLLLVAAVWEFDLGSGVAGVLPGDVTAVTVEMAIVALVILVAALRGDHDSEELFVVVWALFMTAAAFTQVRFNYYLGLSVVVLNAYLIGEFLEYVRIVRPDGSWASEIEPYQVMIAMLALLVIIPGLVTPFTYHERQLPNGQTQQFTSDTAVQVGNNTGPRGITNWKGSLDWMSQETPEEGTYGDASRPMDQYGTYRQTDDFEYDEGAYGVMSWWDYGHWITVEGERIPNANPFQQGATSAANFLLAPNESRANEVLERGAGDGEETRYVVVDSQMANPYQKFSAPTVFYDDSNVSFVGDFVSPYHYQIAENGRAQPAYRLNKQRYYESMMVRLYRYHGSRAQPEPVVFDWEERNGTRVIPENGGFQDFRGAGPQGRLLAQRALENDTTPPENSSAIGGVGHWPRETVTALEHYRLVHASGETTASGRGESPAYLREVSRVKTFERVPGATVRGEGPANTSVTASVQMRMGTRNATFTYTQVVETDGDGSFEMTVPYSTTGYDEYGPENGHTNVSVRAVGPYQFVSTSIDNRTLVSYQATANVTEGQVVGDDESATTVTLERVQRQSNQTDGNQTDTGNQTDDGNTTDGNSSAVRSPPATDASADRTGGDSAGVPVTDGGAAVADPGSDLAGGISVGGSLPVPAWLALVALFGAVLVEVRDDRRD